MTNKEDKKRAAKKEYQEITDIHNMLKAKKVQKYQDISSDGILMKHLQDEIDKYKESIVEIYMVVR